MALDVHSFLVGARRGKGKKTEAAKPVARHAADPWETAPPPAPAPTAPTMMETIAPVAPTPSFVDPENGAVTFDVLHEAMYSAFASFQHLMTPSIKPVQEINQASIERPYDIDIDI